MAADSQSAPVDILDILLRAEPETTGAGLPDLDRLLRRAVAVEATSATAPAAPRLVRPHEHRSGHPAERKAKKIKTTQYLAPETQARLNRVRDALAASAKAAPSGRAGRISKSRIVEAALRQALGEFEAKGPDSRLARALETATDEA